MGMTDKQFNSFMKLILKFIEQALKADDDKERLEKLEELKNEIQSMIED